VSFMNASGGPRQEQSRFDDEGFDHDQAPGGRRRGATIVWIGGIVIAVGLIVLMVVLHTTGVMGPGRH
jgi:hypothetical protein